MTKEICPKFWAGTPLEKKRVSVFTNLAQDS